MRSGEEWRLAGRWFGQGTQEVTELGSEPLLFKHCVPLLPGASRDRVAAAAEDSLDTWGSRVGASDTMVPDLGGHPVLWLLAVETG